MEQGKVLNHIGDLEIKMTPDRGRGIFATKLLKMGDLVLVESAVAGVVQNRQMLDGFNLATCHIEKRHVKQLQEDLREELTKNCIDVAQLKGVEAYRMSFLYAGGDKSDLKIPPLDIFTDNHYKKYNIPDINCKHIQDIIKHNETLQLEQSDMKNALFCFKSFINHSSNPNLKIEHVQSSMVFIFASKDI